ncbi:hypothetical protein IWQ61_004828 [Dispira simplex]|nr:hypothetical protein IWQ61_004828 [Dispira simplex]
MPAPTTMTLPTENRSQASNRAATTAALLAQSKVITFIGGGNMAEAILGGLLAKGFQPSHIRVSDPMEGRCQYLHSKYQVLAYTDNSQAILGQRGPYATTANTTTEGRPTDIVIMAVKPQVLETVIAPIAPLLVENKPLIISIAAGIRTRDLQRWVKQHGGQARTDASGTLPSVVRCMPNTPALVGHGASGLYAEPSVSDAERRMSSEIMGAVSKSFWLDSEDLIDAVTAVSGSGPAYFFLMLEAMKEGGEAAGLPGDLAAQLAAQTCLGAAHMVLQATDDSAADLRRKVTSPKGTTEAAVNTMVASGLKKAVVDGVLAANSRSKELADILGKQ